MNLNKRIIIIVASLIVAIISLLLIVWNYFISSGISNDEEEPRETTTITTYTPSEPDDISQMNKIINEIYNEENENIIANNSTEKREISDSEYERMLEEIRNFLMLREWNNVTNTIVKTKQNYNITDSEKIINMTNYLFVSDLNTNFCANQLSVYHSITNLENKALIFAGLSSDKQAMVITDLNYPLLPQETVENITSEECDIQKAHAEAFAGDPEAKFYITELTFFDHSKFVIYWAYSKNVYAITFIQNILDENAATYQSYYEMNDLEYEVCTY